MASELEAYVGRLVNIITSDGHSIVGTLKGFDNVINLIVNDSHERVFSPERGVEQVPLGLSIIRGQNVFLWRPQRAPYHCFPFICALCLPRVWYAHPTNSCDLVTFTYILFMEKILHRWFSGPSCFVKPANFMFQGIFKSLS
uniref:U6 snRNA-associated Sm-like protein LSm8 n=1 Tax=Mesocestoides corti TaxID=53468 RepID=A0A5K3EIF5_MESCO